MFLIIKTGAIIAISSLQMVVCKVVEQRILFMSQISRHNEFQLVLNAPDGLVDNTQPSPFIFLLKNSLQQHLGYAVNIQIRQNKQGQPDGQLNQYWINLQQNGQPLMVSFQYTHAGLEPGVILLIILVFGLIAIIITANRFARELTTPMENLARAAAKIGSGNPIEPLAEQGTLELANNNQQIIWQPTPLPEQQLHALAIRRILINLLDNAIRYGEFRLVEIRAFTDSENKVMIDVCDRGEGIPENELEAVFQPLYRLEKSRNSQTGGSGLGLNIVRQLAESNRCNVRLLPRKDGGICARLTITGF